MSNITGQMENVRTTADFQITMTSEAAEKEIKLGEVVNSLVNELGLGDAHFNKAGVTKAQIDEMLANHEQYCEIWKQMLR